MLKLYKLPASLSTHHLHSFSDMYQNYQLGENTTVFQAKLFLPQVQQTFPRTQSIKLYKFSPSFNHHHMILKCSASVSMLAHYPDPLIQKSTPCLTLTIGKKFYLRNQPLNTKRLSCSKPKPFQD